MLHPEKGVHEVLQSFRVGREATPQGLEGSFCGQRAVGPGHKG